MRARARNTRTVCSLPQTWRPPRGNCGSCRPHNPQSQCRSMGMAHERPRRRSPRAVASPCLPTGPSSSSHRPGRESRPDHPVDREMRRGRATTAVLHLRVRVPHRANAFISRERQHPASEYVPLGPSRGKVSRINPPRNAARAMIRAGRSPAACRGTAHTGMLVPCGLPMMKRTNT